MMDFNETAEHGMLREAVLSGVERVSGPAVAGEVVRHRERSRHPARHAFVHVVLDLGDLERRCAVAKILERVVADVQHPLGEVALARDSEVPGEKEVIPLHPGAVEGLEGVLHVRPPLLDSRVRRLRPVAVGAERFAGLDRGTGAILEPS